MPAQVLTAGGIALLLTAAGLTASLFHPANPKNAWRAFSRFRISWLSREEVFAMLFFPCAIIYPGLTWLGAQGLEPMRLTAGALATLLAWATVFSTGMIYGCLKAICYFWMTAPGVASSLNSATGFTRERVRLFDTGHTHGTFLSQEFGYPAARRRIVAMKALVFLAAFAVPLLALFSLGHGGARGATWGAIAAAFAGLLAGRWLFFAEARHAVNLYHGA